PVARLPQCGPGRAWRGRPLVLGGEPVTFGAQGGRFRLCLVGADPQFGAGFVQRGDLGRGTFTGLPGQPGRLVTHLPALGPHLGAPRAGLARAPARDPAPPPGPTSAHPVKPPPAVAPPPAGPPRLGPRLPGLGGSLLDSLIPLRRRQGDTVRGVLPDRRQLS